MRENAARAQGSAPTPAATGGWGFCRGRPAAPRPGHGVRRGTPPAARGCSAPAGPMSPEEFQRPATLGTSDHSSMGKEADGDAGGEGPVSSARHAACFSGRPRIFPLQPPPPTAPHLQHVFLIYAFLSISIATTVFHVE